LNSLNKTILCSPISFYSTRSINLVLNLHSFNILYIWRNHYTRDVTTKKCDALKISTETNQAQFCLISGTAAFMCWCRVRIEIIYPNRWFYSLITSLFVVRMRIIISLGLRPRDISRRIRSPNSDVIER
jgi:hypothetical protein